MENGQVSRMSVPQVVGMKGREKIAMLTAYDYPTARVLDEAGVDIILVGDSLAMVVLGHENTLAVTMDEMIHHTKAVSRGVTHALVVGDMPYMSYQVSIRDALRNAGRFIKEGGANAVKIEGGKKRVELVRALLDAEIPVMGHIGLTPQSIHKMGGYRVQGKDKHLAEALVEDAKALDEENVFAIVLEGIPKELARVITASVAVPTIGIGAGMDCDGQVLVFHDLVGMGKGYHPKFVRCYLNLHEEIREGVERYIVDVKRGAFPEDGESYHASSQIRELISEWNRGKDGDR